MLTTVQKVSRRDRAIDGGVLTGWHLVSLDAPTVAMVWTWFVARSAGVVLPRVELAAMFVAVWVLYAADRLLDARAGRDGDGLELRHHFHFQHRRAFRWGIALGALVLACLLPSMLPEEIRLYLVLGGLLLGWFLLIHSGPRPLPKEFVVGIFFAAAVFVPTVARVPVLRAELFWPAVMFGALCSVNCVFIFAWEHPGDRPAQHFRGTNVAASCVLWLAAGLSLVAFALAGYAGPVARGPLAATGLAAALLAGLHLVHARVEKTTLRALADLLLVLPVMLWLR